MTDAAIRPRTCLALCAGYGGLELAIALACPGVRLVGAVERQAYAAAVLANRMAQGAVDPCPIFDDLESFDGRAYRGRVDIVAAGFPCQGASVAGKRLGTEDARWLWPEVWRIAIEVEATWLLVENVPGLLSVNGGGAFAEILGDLGARGWAAEWDCVPAAAVGAPHLRDRLFLLAANPERLAVRKQPERDQRDRGRERKAERQSSKPDRRCSARAPSNADGDRCEAGSADDDRARSSPGALAVGAPERPASDASREQRAPGGRADEHALGANAARGSGQTSADADIDGIQASEHGRAARGDEGRAQAIGGGEHAAYTDDASEQSSERARRARQERSGDDAGGSSGQAAANAASFGRDEGRAIHAGAGREGGADAARGDQSAEGARHASNDMLGCEGGRHGRELDTGIGAQLGGDLDGCGGAWSGHTLDLVGAISNVGRSHWDWGRAPEPCIRGVDDGASDGMGLDEQAYADQLHLLGNGVVWEAACAAFVILWDRLHGTDLSLLDGAEG